MGVIAMVALIALAWVACAIVAYATHTLGTLLLWSIPIPVTMLAWGITMQWLYLDRVNVFTLRMHRRSPAKEQRKAIRPAGNSEKAVRHPRHSEDGEHLDAAA
jgi:hypothetical protein